MHVSRQELERTDSQNSFGRAGLQERIHGGASQRHTPSAKLGAHPACAGEAGIQVQTLVVIWVHPHLHSLHQPAPLSRRLTASRLR